MKRDLDLTRKLLIFFEEKPDPDGVEVPPIEGFSESEIKYNLKLMHEAGFLNCERIRSQSDPERIIYVIPFDLTWEGHEFLQSIKDDNLWQKLKEHVVKPSASWSFVLIRAWIKHELMLKFGIGQTGK